MKRKSVIICCLFLTTAAIGKSSKQISITGRIIDYNILHIDGENQIPNEEQLVAFYQATAQKSLFQRVPLKEIARSLRSHRALILNWFRARKQFNNGIVEGLNANAKLAFRKAYGYRTLRAAEVSLYHQLGHLPEPKLTHEFC